ncbi:MAG: hypothetical protein JSR77_11455 [Planctomycetes bacterium]|nr:hypothetical protein [Planctomycetota bacterium]
MRRLVWSLGILLFMYAASLALMSTRLVIVYQYLSAPISTFGNDGMVVTGLRLLCSQEFACTYLSFTPKQECKPQWLFARQQLIKRGGTAFTNFEEDFVLRGSSVGIFDQSIRGFEVVQFSKNSMTGTVIYVTSPLTIWEVPVPVQLTPWILADLLAVFGTLSILRPAAALGKDYLRKWRKWRRSRSNSALRCFECGYELTGVPGPLCPECGSPTDSSPGPSKPS